MTKNATGFDKCKYSGYGTEFDVWGCFSLSNDSGFGKNVIIFVADMSSPVHIDNKKNGIVILSKGWLQIKHIWSFLLSNKRNFVCIKCTL